MKDCDHVQGIWTYILAVWLVFVGFVVQDVAPIELDLDWLHSYIKIPWLQAALRRVRSQSLSATEVAKKDDPVVEELDGKAWRPEEQRPVPVGGEQLAAKSEQLV